MLYFSFEESKRNYPKRVQQEFTSDSESYKETFRKYITKYNRNKFYLENSMPVLGDVRGKIVLLTALPYVEGIWFLGQEIQDEYNNPGYLDKKEKIRDHIIRSSESSGQKLYINHLSATGFLSMRTPWDFAQVMNPYALHLMQNVFVHSVQLGVIVYDYAGSSGTIWDAHDNLLAKAIIARNNFQTPLP